MTAGMESLAPESAMVFGESKIRTAVYRFTGIVFMGIQGEAYP